MLAKLYHYLVLPKPITEFEASYLRRTNRIGLAFFALHVPVFTAIAYFNDTGPLLALGLTLAVMTGPAIANVAFRNPRSVSVVYGFTAMMMGGLLVHFGQGPMQIEMHFYFFALLAMLALYGNPMVIVVAAVTVALHHLALWLVLPSSVFNYEAPVWVVLVHAAFVVLESVATCYIARSFFDNVIGLEKIVAERTSALDERNRDMRLVLDNVNQGFLTIDRDMVMSSERSEALGRWLGAAEGVKTLEEYLGKSAPEFSTSFWFAWKEVIDGVMPLELTVDQLPKRFDVGDRRYQLAVEPIRRGEDFEKALVIISDVTADVERERLEAEQRDVLRVVGHMTRDKSGLLEFFAEAREQIEFIRDPAMTDLATFRRVVHTLKGNSLLFGLHTIGEACHAMETVVDERFDCPSIGERRDFAARWDRLCTNLDALLGARENGRIEVRDQDYDQLVSAVLEGAPRAEIARTLQSWRLEPTVDRLARVGEQAQSIAARLEKGALRVVVEDDGVRLDPKTWAPFWASMVHVVRNAVDHGIEDSASREHAGKSPSGTLTLSTRFEGDELVIGLEDDGRGVDWSAVAEKARAVGAPHATQEELCEALFRDGVSTKREVTEYSGRGIGMGAVRVACAERGGVVRIASEPGVRTLVEFRFPRERATDECLRVAS
jgi:two-component system, chemotaxis family, sensor kinase CheA